MPNDRRVELQGHVDAALERCNELARSLIDRYPWPAIGQNSAHLEKALLILEVLLRRDDPAESKLRNDCAATRRSLRDPDEWADIFENPKKFLLWLEELGRELRRFRDQL